jgi:hypothetical protein
MPVPIAVAPRLTSRNSRRLADSRDILLHGRVEGVELLAQRHRHGVLQLGAADLQYIGEFDRFGLEGIGKLLQRFDQRRGRENNRQPQRSRIGVVGRLSHVDIIVGMQTGVIAPRLAH